MVHRRKNIPLRDLRTYGYGRAVRLPDFDYAGDAVIHMTICADRGRPFEHAALARMTCGSAEKSCELRSYKLFGYTLMPDHLHVLLSPADSGQPIADWLQSFKGYTTSQFMKRGGKPPLWQPSGNDHVCRTAETAERVLGYIVNNPVRAGLVECWQDWPWTKVFIEL